MEPTEHGLGRGERTGGVHCDSENDPSTASEEGFPVIPRRCKGGIPLPSTNIRHQPSSLIGVTTPSVGDPELVTGVPVIHSFGIFPPTVLEGSTEFACPATSEMLQNG